MNPVTIYQANIFTDFPTVPQEAIWLSEEEWQRARRFHFQKDQHRFIMTHHFLRRILAQETQESPQTLVLTQTPYGKPMLQGFPELHFNLSHAHERVIVAVSQGQPIGVDIEHLRPIEELDLARRFFNAEEVETLQALEPEQRLTLFFRLWTCKEAYLKATGEGLRGLGQVRILLEPLQVQDKRLSPEESQHWHLIPIQTSEEYCATAAIYHREAFESR